MRNAQPMLTKNCVAPKSHMLPLAARARTRRSHGVGLAGVGGGGGTRAASAELAHGCRAGSSRTTIQKAMAARSPSTPYRRNTPRQLASPGRPSQETAARAVSTGAIAPPIRPPNATALLSRPRSPADAHRRTSPAAAGYAPASHAPSPSRTARRTAALAARDVNAVHSDHATMDRVSTARGPYRSASDPIGIWNRA